MDLTKFTAKIVYFKNGEIITTAGDDVVAIKDAKYEKNVLKASIEAKEKVELVSVSFVYDRPMGADELFYVNGYQSWTTSREFTKAETQKGLSWICANLPLGRKLTACYGDYDFTTYSKDLFHSFTYTYFRKGDSFQLFGSLNERNGYTIYYVDKANGKFEILKEVEGVTVEGVVDLFEIYTIEGDYDEVFDGYFAAYPLKSRNSVKHLAGYTSWYNYYQKIDEATMFRDLKGMHDKVGDKASIFQIDDGYESMVGDWHVLDPVKFPSGSLRPLVDEIHKDGYLAGLWLAPFGAQFKSKICLEHDDWLIKDKKGENLYAGFAWGGFYALDIEIPEVREYIKGVFDEVFDGWNFDMVKLDFLYATCMQPRNGKSRGQLMCEGMEFLRECCRDKLILGCGVPLGPAWGYVDACRISCDAELSFKDRFYTKMTNQEIISTQNSITNSIYRRHLNGRIFVNDPDVFFLRYDGLKKIKYSLTQKKAHSKINHMFGDVLFVSDNIGVYDDEQLEICLNAFAPFEGKINTVSYKDRTYTIEYTDKGDNKKLVLNMDTGEFTDNNYGVNK